MIQHIPVLLNEVIASIPENAQFLIDGTLGHAGHTEAILQKFPKISVLGIDRDPIILSKTQSKLQKYSNRFQAIQWTYADMDIYSQSKKSDFILLDIWVNMEHYKDSSRGFSINWDFPLDMRFDPTQWIPASQRIAKASIGQLQRCFVEYADFSPKKAEELAITISRAKSKSPISSTRQLREILGSCWLWWPASSVIFQAIRIEVNQELEQLKIFLSKLPSLLKSWARCWIITFHSIEDRIVKNAFKEFSSSLWRELYSKKAIKPTYQEVQKNRASRSAKYRVIIGD